MRGTGELELALPTRDSDLVINAGGNEKLGCGELPSTETCCHVYIALPRKGEPGVPGGKGGKKPLRRTGWGHADQFPRKPCSTSQLYWCFRRRHVGNA